MKTFILSSLLVLCALTAQAKAPPPPKDFSVQVFTKDVQGAKVTIKSRIEAPPDAVWHALLDCNHHAKRFPRLTSSFCMVEADALAAKKKKLRNTASVRKLAKKNHCNPSTSRGLEQTWSYFLFQELDYPFPLSDRWVIAKVDNDATKPSEYRQHGTLVYGLQKAYEFEIVLTPYAKDPKQSVFVMHAHTDPGGIIPAWMIEQATKYMAPQFVRSLQREARRRMTGNSSLQARPAKTVSPKASAPKK